MTMTELGALSAAAGALAIGLMPLGRTWMPHLGPHPDRRALSDAGWQLGLGRWEVARGLVILAGVGLASGVGMIPLVGLAAGLIPSILIRMRAQSARDRARGSVAQILVSAHAMLRSGIALPEALRRAAAACEDRLARRPFEIALERFDLGDPLDEALRGAAAGADRRLAGTFHTLAIGVTERLPIERAASLLEAMAERAVHDERLDAEIRARTAGVRAQSYLLAAIVPGLALYLVATMPGLGATLSTTLGRTVLVPVAAVLEISGILVGRRIVRGVSR